MKGREIKGDKTVFEKESLPKGWIKTTIGYIYDLVGGGTPSTKIRKYWKGDISWISSADIHGLYDIRPRRKITPEAIKNSATNLVPAGSIIVVTRVGLGKIARTKTPLCFSQDSQALIENVSFTHPDYVLYYLSQTVQLFKHTSRGTTISGVTKKQLSQLTLPLPPTNEQKRIVSKIESIFAQIDAERKSLDNAKVLLKQCRQSVLKSAFEGKLVPQDPNDEPAEALLNRIHKDSSDKLFFEKNSLPQGWTSKHLTNIAKINPKKPENGTIDDDLEVSFIPMKCVKELTGNIDLSITRKYTEVKKGYTCFKNGDIIFAKITPCMENGKIAIVHDLKNEIGFGSTEFHVIRLKDNHLSPKFYFYYLIQDNFRDCAQRNMKGTAGQLRVPSDYLKNSMIPIPPLPEQKRIISKIESIFGRIDAEHNFAIFVTVFSYKTKSTCLHPICSSDLQLTPLQSQELISGYLKFHPQEFLALAGFLNHLTTRLLARICLAKFYLSLLYHHTNMI